MYRFIDSFLFSVIYPVLLVLSVLAGYLIAETNYRKKSQEWKSSGVESAVIGIFALLLSFTFLTSGNASRERSVNIHNESDAVANLRRESLFMSDSLKAMTKDFLMVYLSQQADFGTIFKIDRAELKQKVSDAMGQYLTQLTNYSRLNEKNALEVKQLRPYFFNVNALFYRNLYSYEERVPLPIILLLIIGSWLIGLLVGFMNGFHQQRHVLVPLIFVVLVGLPIGAILDMNNPAKGSIKPDYHDFRYQKEMLEKSTR